MTERKKLLSRRATQTVSFTFIDGMHREFPHRATLGYYDDGRLGEVFLNSDKRQGTQLDANARDAAVVLSIALQHGSVIEELQSAVLREEDGRPSTVIGALLDYIVAHGLEKIQ